jgi:hypothetical protein
MVCQRYALAVLPPGERDPVPIVQENGWAPGPVWTGMENVAPLTGIRSPDGPAGSESLYRLSYRDALGEQVLLDFCFVSNSSCLI